MSYEFSFRSSVGASDGLVIIWDNMEVEVQSSFSFEHVLVINERFLHTNGEFFLFNIYAPCDVADQQLLQDSLTVKLGNCAGKNFCVSDDFNAVCGMEERRSVGAIPRLLGSGAFNQFIEKLYMKELLILYEGI